MYESTDRHIQYIPGILDHGINMAVSVNLHNCPHADEHDYGESVAVWFCHKPENCDADGHSYFVFTDLGLCVKLQEGISIGYRSSEDKHFTSKPKDVPKDCNMYGVGLYCTKKLVNHAKSSQ